MTCAACGHTDGTKDIRLHDHRNHDPFIYIGYTRQEIPVVGLSEQMIITTRLYACPKCGTVRVAEATS
jgi:hypothetical protein